MHVGNATGAEPSLTSQTLNLPTCTTMTVGRGLTRWNQGKE